MKKKILDYYCQSISELFHIPMTIFSKDSGEMELDAYSDFEAFSIFLTEKDISSFYTGKNLFNTDKMVSYYLSDDNIAFGCISDMASNYCIYLGPCLLSDLNEDLMKAMMNRHNSPFVSDPNKYHDLLHTYLSTLPRISDERFMMLLKFTNNYVNNVILEAADFQESSLSKRKLKLNKKPAFRISESEKLELANRTRDNIIAFIKTADAKGFANYWPQIKEHDPLLLESDDPDTDIIRLNKNAFIRFVSYTESSLSRTYLSDRQLNEIVSRYINEAENTIIIPQLETLYHSFITEMIKAVADSLSDIDSDDLVLNKAVRYIHDHIYENISAASLAADLAYSRGYLSALFNKKLHLSIPEYISQEKVRIAKVLLEETDTRLIDIANYLSFSSQSYFQNIFKKITGVTPMTCRKLNNTD